MKRYTVIEPSDGAFGSLSNGSYWNGIVKMLMDKVCMFRLRKRKRTCFYYYLNLKQECDMGAAHFSMTYERYQVVDFTIGFFEEATAST